MKSYFDSVRLLIALVVITSLSVVAHARNSLWSGDAVALWEDVVEKSPQKARGYYLLGRIYEKRNRIQDATKSYSQAIALKPSAEVAEWSHVNRGNLLDNAGMTEQALEDYNAAIAINPRSILAYFNRGFTYKNRNKIEQALEDLSKAIAIGSQHPIANEYDYYAGVFFLRGDIFALRGQIDLAISDYRAACSRGYYNGCYAALRAKTRENQ